MLKGKKPLSQLYIEIATCNIPARLDNKHPLINAVEQALNHLTQWPTHYSRETLRHIPDCIWSCNHRHNLVVVAETANSGYGVASITHNLMFI